jgi:hypothetical protein
VVIDMSAAYTNGVSDRVWNTRLVYEKFNDIYMVMEACNQVQKADSPADAGTRDLLERTR